MNPVSTYSFLMSQQMIMTDTAQLSEKLSTQLSTGKRAVDLADNPDRERILDLTMSKNNRDSYVKSSTLGELVTSQYTISLTHLETLTNNALKAVQGLRTTFTGIPTPSNSTIQQQIDALAKFTQLGASIDQTMVDTKITLNEKSSSGDGYLYSGLRSPTTSPIPTWTLPPVSDLTALPYFLPANPTLAGDLLPHPTDKTTIPGYNDPASPASALTRYNPATLAISPSSPVAPPAVPTVDVDFYAGPIATAAGVSPRVVTGLPVYDSDYGTHQKFTDPASAAFDATGASVARLRNTAYGSQKLTIDDNETIGINITSNDAAFQDMINGLRAAKTACDQAGNYSTTDRDNFMDLAYSYLSKGLNGIRLLEQKNTIADTAMKNKVKIHTESLDVINTRLDQLVGVDTTSVTVQLATANNQLQASYKATATLLGMSLMNYLK
ncbi:MAG: hypothetical protein WCF85_04465 [Rhodospirillaceae bacterium]